MTDEQINKAIAEACGWTECNGYIGKPPTLKMDHNRSLPNYAGCLNAMHEAEKFLFSSKSGYYERSWYSNLVFVVTGLDPSNDGWGDVDTREHSYVAHATAAQRAEAFLRTIDKWEEEA